jgi:tetratricopeptide (TPR) repeat protein
LRLDDVQFELRPLQPRASPAWIVCAVVVESALRRLYPVSCALQIGNGVLPRLRPRAFPARSLRRHPGENGRLELLRGRHWATPICLRFGDRASLAEPPQHCKRDYDHAIADYNQAFRLDPNLAIAFNSRGQAYANKGDYDRATGDYNGSIRLDPKYAPTFNNRATSYVEKRDYDRATADYSEAIRLDPKYAFALNNPGLAYADKRDYDRAVGDFSETIRLDPKLAIAFYGRANTYREKGDRDRAIEDFREARAGTE